LLLSASFSADKWPPCSQTTAKKFTSDVVAVSDRSLRVGVPASCYSLAHQLSTDAARSSRAWARCSNLRLFTLRRFRYSCHPFYLRCLPLLPSFRLLPRLVQILDLPEFMQHVKEELVDAGKSDKVRMTI
jgi:hypothetical protein